MRISDWSSDVCSSDLFAYHAPTTVEEAVGLLADLGEEARPLAGGHSLIPMMKLRLAPLEHLVDLRRIAALKGIREEGAALVIGAITTQADLLASDLVAARCPILQDAAPPIAAPQVRYIGTVARNGPYSDPPHPLPSPQPCPHVPTPR